MEHVRALPWPFFASEAREHGLTDYAVSRRGGGTGVTRGMRLDPAVTTDVQVPDWADTTWVRNHVLISAVQRLRPEAVASHSTAALILGLPVPVRLRRAVHLTVPRGTTEVRRKGIVSHRSRWYDPIERHGVTMNAEPYVLFAIAEQLSVHELVQVLDALVGNWHGPPRATIRQVREVLEDHHGFRGRKKLIAALDLARPGVDSPRETDLRLRIIGAGLPEPVIAHPIDLPEAGVRIHPDLCFPEEKILIEYDGDHHRLDRRQWLLDKTRYAEAEAAGWKVFSVHSGTDWPRFLTLLRRALADRRSRQ